MKGLIAPHGGTLINRLASEAEAQEWRGRQGELPSLVLNNRQVSDLEMIGTGGLSPLTGFMGRADYQSVVDSYHLANGLPWTIPITLGASEEQAGSLQEGQDVALLHEDGSTLLGILHLSEKFTYDAEREAQRIYRTTDQAHPGVAAMTAQGAVLLGGDVTVLQLPPYGDFPTYRLTPAQARQAFDDRGWKRVVAFQTRNPVHRAHEYIQKCALEMCDGLLLHPLVGATKGDDIPADVRMQCYEVLLDNYYPKDRVLLAVNPAAMRYAGPSEAIFHAIVRKNYGCTHFIVGRDHAGVGNYYGTYDAQLFFDEFDPKALDITPLMFEHSFYCQTCEGMGTAKTCPHDKSHHVSIAGTKVREMLRAGEIPPQEFTRPEIAKVLIAATQNAG